MPAAAVIPAPIAYIKVVAVKKLVVGFLELGQWSAFVSMYFVWPHPCSECMLAFICRVQELHRLL